MKSIYVLLGLISLVALVACSGNVGVGTPQPPSGGATATAPVLSTDAYPPQPTATPLPEDYPAPSPQAPPTDYPADMQVWLLRPMGQQCVDPATYEFANLDAAIEALEEAGIEVLASEAVELSVCESCDCPTSEHFRVQIGAEDLAVAQSMGWFQE